MLNRNFFVILKCNIPKITLKQVENKESLTTEKSVQKKNLSFPNTHEEQK